MTDLYEAIDRGLAHTTDIDDALFIDREGRLRTNPVRKPPPGGEPAHLSALLEVPELAGCDEPLYVALDAGMVRIRTVRTTGTPALSLTANIPLSAAQMDRLRPSSGRTEARSPRQLRWRARRPRSSRCSSK